MIVAMHLPATVVLFVLAAGGTSIQAFFNNLTNDVFGFILTASIFALGWAAFLYMFAGENERRLQSAKFWLYAAMIGLAVALLGPTIAGLINTAAGGAGQ
jgi:Type IV secretion system pilin